VLTKAKHLFEEYERRISIASLMGGFVVDSLTLQNIDNLWDNLWIGSNIIVAGLCILILSRKKNAIEGFWLPNILQFSIGALLGSTFVFYLRSTTLSATWPFLALLLFAILANEFFLKRFEKLALRLSFFYFSLFSFLIFFVPILVNHLGTWAFLLSGVISLGLIYLFIHLLSRMANEKFLEEKTHIWYFVAVIFISINALYFARLIPPIPLALKDGGIYHTVAKGFSGNYLVQDEVRGWERFFTFRTKVHIGVGEPLYAYTAIYSPGSLNTDIVHEWQYKDKGGKWVTATKIPLRLEGGRSGGFRTFSSRPELSIGPWRVEIKTPSGHIIGRLNFEVVRRNYEVSMVTEIKK